MMYYVHICLTPTQPAEEESSNKACEYPVIAKQIKELVFISVGIVCLPF